MNGLNKFKNRSKHSSRKNAQSETLLAIVKKKKKKNFI